MDAHEHEVGGSLEQPMLLKIDPAAEAPDDNPDTSDAFEPNRRKRVTSFTPARWAIERVVAPR